MVAQGGGNGETRASLAHTDFFVEIVSAAFEGKVCAAADRRILRGTVQSTRSSRTNLTVDSTR